MQLKQKRAGHKKLKNIRGPLAAATVSLLGGHATQVLALQADSDWEVDASVLIYSERDRVSLVEPLLRVRKDFSDDRYLNGRIVIDSLTGSSPNGAFAVSTAQTFTSPSGKSTYTAAAGETPLDPAFKDIRFAGSVDWEQPLSEGLNATLGANASKEYDYRSVGLSINGKWDLNRKNSTLSAALAYNADQIKPIGGAPVALTSMPLFSAAKTVQGKIKDKDTSDILLGWTQIIGRGDLLQFNVNHGRENGYLNDPYKIIAVVDGNGALIADAANRYLYEARPGSRDRNAFFAQWVHAMDENVLRLSYRFYSDDWGIRSHTMDARYSRRLGRHAYIQPHIRYYSQSAADFYRIALLDGANEAYASADYRLSRMTGATLGIKYAWTRKENKEASVRLEVMNQAARAPDTGVAVRPRLPDVDAVILQFNYIVQF